MDRGGKLPAAVAVLVLVAAMTGCARVTVATSARAPQPAGTPPAPAAQPAPGGQEGQPGQQAGGGQQQAQPRPYAQVITARAVTKAGLFKVHQVGQNLFFEIPRSEFGKELLVLRRTAAGGPQTGFFGGGPSRVVAFEREGNRILLRGRSHNITADPSAAIYEAVRLLNVGPIVAAFNIESW